ncbi:MAG: SGNH/GDSL hydrolase family protein [Lachnospiraceae bacterium]
MNENKTCRGLWLRHILFTTLGFILCMLIIIGTQMFYRAKLIWELEITNLETQMYDVAYITSEKCSDIDYSIIDLHYNFPVQSYIYRDGRDSVYELEKVLETLIREDNHVGIVYLELNPSYHNTEEIISLITQQTETLFHIILRPYSIDEWGDFAVSNRMDSILQEYSDLAEQLLTLEHVDVFYYGNKEWFTDNPMYFEDTNKISSDALMEIYTEINMNSTMFASLTIENMEEEIVSPDFDTEIDTYADLEGVNIYYLGDSMYGKDKNQSGIAEITSNYLNANGYNLAVMGTSISGDGEFDYLRMVETLVAGALDENIPNIVVIRYGFNDYSTSASLEDSGLFVTNFKQGIDILQATFPGVTIILSTPTICPINYRDEPSLKEYVDKIEEIAIEKGVYCLNNYNVDIFTEGDPNNTLIDGVHYNVRGRFRQAERLAEFISTSISF